MKIKINIEIDMPCRTEKGKQICTRTNWWREAMGIDWYSGSGGSQPDAQQDLVAPTLSELEAYAAANQPPNFWMEGDDGIVNKGTTEVTITPHGTPTIVADQFNGHSVIRFNGTDQDLQVTRVNILTMIIVFKHYAGAHILNVPTNNTGTANSDKFYKQGFVNPGGNTLYDFYPKSEGETLRPSITEIALDNTKFRTFVCRGEGYTRMDGKSWFRDYRTAVAETTVTNMFFAARSNGEGSTIADWTQYDLAEVKIWSRLLTDDEIRIEHAILELKYNSYGKISYLFKPILPTFEATNPVVDGNSFSSGAQDESYPPKVIRDGDNLSMIYKVIIKNIGGSFATIDDLSQSGWTDNPVVVPSGTGAQWDTGGANAAVFFKRGSKYWILYSGINSSSEKQIGVATSNSALSGYTKYGSNPVVTIAAVNTALSSSFEELQVCVEPMFINGEWRLYLIANPAGKIPGQIIVARDLTWDDDNGTFTVGSYEYVLNRDDVFLKTRINLTYSNTLDATGLPQIEWLEFGSLIKLQNQFIGMMAVGRHELLTSKRTKVIIPIWSPDGDNFKTISDVFIDAGELGSWNDVESYFPSIMKVQDNALVTPDLVNNKMLIFFAGGDNATSTHFNSGLAYADPYQLIERIIP